MDEALSNLIQWQSEPCFEQEVGDWRSLPTENILLFSDFLILQEMIACLETGFFFIQKCFIHM